VLAGSSGATGVATLLIGLESNNKGSDFRLARWRSYWPGLGGGDADPAGLKGALICTWRLKSLDETLRLNLTLVPRIEVSSKLRPFLESPLRCSTSPVERLWRARLSAVLSLELSNSSFMVSSRWVVGVAAPVWFPCKPPSTASTKFGSKGRDLIREWRFACSALHKFRQVQSELWTVTYQIKAFRAGLWFKW